MLLGISGKIGSGKDVIGEYLKDNYDFKIVKFATLIKEISAKLTNTPYDLHFSQEGKSMYLTDWGMTVREFQQRLGTDAMREGLHKDCWVIATLSRYVKGNKWVVTDVRFKNEVESILNREGKIIRVERLNNPYAQSNHISETELDSYNFKEVVQNSGSLSDLYKKIDTLLEGQL